MKPEKIIFFGMAIFFGIVTPVYYLMSKEPAGTFVFLFTCALCLMVGSYLHITSKQFDPRPEDRKDGEVYEAAGEVGFFAPKSIWPFWVALTISVIFLGPALHQWWITAIGFVMGVWSVAGWIYEFYRGDYQH